MILTRSPYYHNVIFTNTFVESVDFTLVVGEGSLSSISERQSYDFTKLKPSENSSNTWIDISPFIRDLYDPSPITTSIHSAPTVVQNNEVLLASLSIRENDTLGNDLTSDSRKYICTDGYGYYMQGQNLESDRSILLSHDSYMAYENGYFIVPLLCDINSTAPTVDGVSVSLNFIEGFRDYVKYLIIPLGGYTDNVTVVYNGETINIELIEECKYPVSEIQFINRYGVIEQVHFYKAQKETLRTDSETFKNAHTNGVSYLTNRHQIKQFNKFSNKLIKIETGFLNPNYNETIQELMQSENVWFNGTPVNLTTSSLEFKTRIVDKLISYSLNFDYAFDEINNV